MVQLKEFLFVLLGVFGWLGWCWGEDWVPPREEVIEEVERVTGLAKDSLELVLGESPELFEQIQETVLGIKIMNKFCEAKDTEALADLWDYTLGKVLEKLQNKTFPPALNTFLLALNVYRDILEVIRDYYFIPKFEEKIYQAYRESRLDGVRRGDTSEEEKQTAFSRAVTQKDSGYYVVKEKMYRNMIKVKGYKEEYLGDKMMEKLRKQIDDFWISRLELRFQQELLIQRRQDVMQTIWNNSSRTLEKIRNRVTSISNPERFFITEQDVPSGWQLSFRGSPNKSKVADEEREFKPQLRQGSNQIYQKFTLKPTEYVEKDEYFTIPVEKKS